MSHPSLQRIDHRPWPLPDRPWIGRQRWLDLLFAHWPVDAGLLRRFVPPPLKVQEFDGTSWIGLVPFRMEDVMLRGIPALPGISAFPELNVRIYVEYQDRPGVWFLSLDATKRLAVWAARRFVYLPYHHAEIDVRRAGDTFRYTSRRTDGQARLEASYRPTSPPCESRPGSLEHWLTERYCLYAQAPDGSIWRNDIHHVPWPLQAAEAETSSNTYFAVHGLSIEGPPALLHFGAREDVIVWNGVRVG